MNGWIDGEWMGEWMGGWVNECMYGLTVRWMDG